MMKKKYWALGAGVVLLLGVGVIVGSKMKIAVTKNEEGSSVSIIGGADGPTSIFLAGKLGGKHDTAEYQSMTMDEAKEIFAQAGDYVILDVRREDEFVTGHLPGAINIANENIGTEQLSELPDLEQEIYVYCRSGRRSKEAAAKLSAAGYQNIIECGGILDWTGELEKE